MTLTAAVQVDSLPMTRPESLPGAPASRRLVCFCSDIADATTLKRIQQFVDNGYSVLVFGFQRTRSPSKADSAANIVVLGKTVDGKYWQRLAALLGAIPVVFRHRKALKAASVFHARNLDQLLLAFFARFVSGKAVPVTYEVLDIPAIMVGSRLASALMRSIERVLLSRTHLLVVSSPAFHREFFAAIQGYRRQWLLMENRLYPPPPRIGWPERSPGRSKRWVVTYSGTIRGDETFNLIVRLADRLRHKVEFRFRGILTTVAKSAFDDALGKYENISYGGPYTPHRDLAEIYSDSDFAWAIDLEHRNHNSRWLLPCRLYEAGFFGVPCLAVHGFELGSLLEQKGIGWTFDAPLEDEIVKFFEALSWEEYQAMRQRLRPLSSSMFVAGNDVQKLCAAIAE